MSFHDPVSFLGPNNVQVEEDETSMKIELSPFERGFGVTIGNSLRRILLSSMPGWAITHLLIKGIDHEFSGIDWVREDVLDIILNLKRVAFRCPLAAKESVKLVLRGEGDCRLLVSDLAEQNPDIEFLNHNDPIATLVGEEAKLQIIMIARYGRGYEAVEERKKDFDPSFGLDISEEDGSWLQIDAIYSPVKRVVCNVESAHFQGRADLDKLILELVTDGTIKPREILARAAGILNQQLAPFMDPNFMVKSLVFEENIKPSDSPELALMRISVSELALPVRTINCLSTEGIKMIGDLVEMSRLDLLKIPNLGCKTVSEIEEALKEKGVSLRQDDENLGNDHSNSTKKNPKIPLADDE